MSEKMTADELRDEINNISSLYDARFAGKPRATRSPQELEELMARLQTALDGAEHLKGDADDAFDVGTNNLQLYKDELAQIHQARSEGAHVIEAAQLATWANFVFDEYSRHFAGMNRGTRDVGRMKEMILELEAIQDDMASIMADHGLESVRADLNTVRENLKLYKEELEKVRQARKAGTGEERVSNMANAANEQFAVYRNLFAGRGRTTRRPSLLERVVNNLTEILSEMRDLNSKATTRSQTNTNNIKIVQENMTLYRSELLEISRARQEATQEDLAGMLGGAANDVMTQYREGYAGKDRASRDLDQLRYMCDELYEIAIQMREIQDEDATLELNNRNLQIVMDTLALYQQEFRRIRDAKGQS